jgi:hypothetical protein
MGGSRDQRKGAHDLIARRAYELWEKRGRPWGSPEVDWLAALREFHEAGLVSLSNSSALPFSAFGMGPAAI